MCLAVIEEDDKIVWKSYVFEHRIARYQNSLFEAFVVSVPHYLKNKEIFRELISKMMNEKAAEPSGSMSEIIK